ncbi:PAS domain S-box protein [Desulfurispirillum indicum]|uniref:chemotaxis protein CheB n=1 Tax=Desulfurispirillum indicum TaxID=936456 RepID=UPI001CF95833|nr:chemotaxis protein CheB [Desulfurispirillum indicum]UCZ57654.1 PAS domain S-box protein [Desulfurispirillum indicum]
MEQPAKGIYIVGIGASAGGLEALRALTSHLPADGDIAYIIAQHLSPSHRSMLVSLLAKECLLPVLEAVDGAAVEAGHIYITPPNYDITLTADEKIRLRQPAQPMGPKPSVDTLLCSLAEVKKEKAIAIILSGTGSDGSVGVRAIKAEGGIVIAQEPSTAKYDSMPNAAISTTHVDLVLPPERIGQEVPEIFRFPEKFLVEKQIKKAPGNIDRIFRILTERGEVDFSGYKLTTLNRRIERRMAATRVTNLGDYVSLLEESADEWKLLFKDILISVTAFFRDRESFNSLEKALESLVANKRNGDSIRVWVPGCATGEEAYTLAVMLWEIVHRMGKKCHMQIFATDIDTDALMHARKGLYSQALLEGMEPALLEKYFTRKGSSFEVAKFLREMIVFSRHNLIKDPPFLRIDLISCRNLLIYFTQPLQKKVFSLFHYSLAPKGILFLGKSESIGDNETLFASFHDKAKIYERKGGVKSPIVSGNGNYALLRRSATPAPKPAKEYRLEDALAQTCLKLFSKCSIVVDCEYSIIHVRGDASNFLTLPSGDFSGNALKMLPRELGIDLRAAVGRLSSGDVPLFRGNLHKIQTGSTWSYVRILASRVEHEGEAVGYFLIVLEEEDNAFALQHCPVESVSEDGHVQIQELQHELISSKEHLQTVIEELETSNEELQSLNEELQSANEELQSSNEELETTNEELQSTNEELSSAYAELKVVYDEKESQRLELVNKTHELQESQQVLEVRQNFITGIMQTSPVGILRIDRDRKIDFINAYAEKLLGFAEHSLLGNSYHVVESLLKSLDTKKLTAEQKPLACALKNKRTLHNLEYAVSALTDVARTLSISITPNFSPGGIFESAVLALVDITEKKRIERELKQKQTELEFINHNLEKRVNEEVQRRMNRETLINAIYDEANVAIGITDTKARIIHANKAFCTTFGYTYDEIIGQSFLVLVPPNRQQAYRQKHRSLMESQDQDRAVERVMRHRNGATLEVLVSRKAIITEDSTPALLSIITDITSMKRIQREKEQQEKILIQQTKMAAMGEMVSAIAHQWRQPLNVVGMLVQDIRDSYRYGMLDQGSLDVKVQRTMETIRFMSDTIDDFRNFFIPDKEKERFDVMESLRQVAHMLSSQMRSHNVVLYRQQVRSGKCVPLLEGKSRSSAPYLVTGYPNEFKQVLFNLLNNSRDAIMQHRLDHDGQPQDGSIHVSISRQGRGRLIIRIVDNGGGIDPEVLPRIFEPYFTTKDQTKGSGITGTGIGLYMAKIIVQDNMGGKISARSIDGGAEFTIEL